MYIQKTSRFDSSTIRNVLSRNGRVMGVTADIVSLRLFSLVGDHKGDRNVAVKTEDADD